MRSSKDTDTLRSKHPFPAFTHRFKLEGFMALEHFCGRGTLISKALLKFKVVRRFSDEKDPYA